MSQTDQIIRKFVDLLPEIGGERNNDVELLIKLGFEPIQQHSGLGMFHEWTKRFSRHGIDLFIAVILDEQVIRAYVCDRSATIKEQTSGSSLESVLEYLLMKIKEQIK